MRGDRTAAQVVAVAEAAGKHDRIDAVQAVVAVPQGHGLCPGEVDGTLGVTVVERARKGDDADAHQWVSPATPCTTIVSPSPAVPSPAVPSTEVPSTEMPTTSSMTELENISSASVRTSPSTASVTGPSTVISKRLPMRTLVNPVLPSLARAPATALPWGSSSSALGMTSTTIVGINNSREFACGWMSPVY